MKSIEDCRNGRKCGTKKIECVRQEDWLGLLGEIEWQDGSKGELFHLNSALIAYIDDGFLTEDDDKWYFFDSEHNLVKAVAKTDLGDCWGIGCFAPKTEIENLSADFYIFEKIVEDGKKEIVYVQSNGEILVPLPGQEADNKIYGYPACLLVDRGPFEDWDYDYENNPECMRLSKAKKDCIANPPLDMNRIAADEARGIRFSLDKHTLISYNTELTDKEYTIPDGVTVIGEYAFSNCGNLTTVTIPDGAKEIGTAAFVFCAGLVKITIPESVTTIGRIAFADCRRLAEVKIPHGVTSIKDGTFTCCLGLTEVKIPYGVTCIGARAFYQCMNLVSADIPDSVTTIGEWAFLCCLKLTAVNIPGNVAEIGLDAFAGCPCVEQPEIKRIIEQKTKSSEEEIPG